MPGANSVVASIFGAQSPPGAAMGRQRGATKYPNGFWARKILATTLFAPDTKILATPLRCI